MFPPRHAWCTVVFTFLYTFSVTGTKSDHLSLVALSFGESIYCPSARRVMLWPHGWTVPSHRLWTQVSQQRAHTDQLTFEKRQSRHEPRRSRDHCGCAWNARLNRRWTVDFTLFFRSPKQVSHSVFPSLKHIQAWRSPSETLSRFRGSGNRSRKVKNRELESVQGKGKNSVRTRETFMNSLKRKLFKLCKENFWSQTRLSEAQAELDGGEWERRHADIALHETGMQLQSQRMELSSGKSIDWPNSKGKELAMWRIRHEKRCFSGRSCKKLPINLRITNLQCRSWKSSTIEAWWALNAKGRESFYSESACGWDSGIARQGEFLERCTRILWSWNCEPLWIIPRSQSTHEYS